MANVRPFCSAHSREGGQRSHLGATEVRRKGVSKGLTFAIYIYILRYIYIIELTQKIEVLVERLTYLFRLCFTGYFQICIFLTFWFKLNFNLLVRLLCVLLSKNPPIPHLIVFVLVLLSIIYRCFLSLFHQRSIQLSWIGLNCCARFVQCSDFRFRMCPTPSISSIRPEPSIQEVLHPP